MSTRRIRLALSCLSLLVPTIGEAQASATTLILVTNTVSARQWKDELLKVLTPYVESTPGSYAGHLSVCGAFGGATSRADRRKLSPCHSPRHSGTASTRASISPTRFCSGALKSPTTA